MDKSLMWTPFAPLGAFNYICFLAEAQALGWVTPRVNNSLLGDAQGKEQSAG